MKINLHFFLNIKKNQKIIINLLIDIVLIITTFFISKKLTNYSNLDSLYQFLFIFIFFNTLLSLILKIYLSVKRYFSSHLILNTLLKNLIILCLLVVLDSQVGLDFIFTFLFIYLFSSLALFLLFPFFLNFKLFNLNIGNKVAIYGAGETGINAYNNLIKNKKNVLAYIDDDPTKIGRFINGIKVHSNFDISSLINKSNIGEIYLAIPSLSSNEEGLLIKNLSKYKNIKIFVHNKKNQTNGAIFNELKNTFKSNILKKNSPKYLKNKTVLITGAAGSIGEEICFQVLDYNINKLIIIDSNENKLSWLKKSIIQKNKKNIDVKFYLTSILDKKNITKIISKHHPNVIFHAAAYKHVDIVEENHLVGIVNNIVGLRNVLLNCKYQKFENFVFISSDKAVNPSNIMGMTKRVGEIMVYNMNKIFNKNFISVRFGNVIGSSGSLFEIFKKQIDNNLPLTVTNKDATRYFMTIFDAINLVIQSPEIKSNAKILVLNMGEPVKILDIAKKLIKANNKNNKIKYIGLRPGEKLHEELFHQNRKIDTKNKMISGELLDINYNLSEINSFTSSIENLSKQSVPSVKKILKKFYKF